MSRTATAFPRTDKADEERLIEVAGILALGILRLRARQCDKNSPNAVDSTDFGVDFGAGQSVCGSEPETDGEDI